MLNFRAASWMAAIAFLSGLPGRADLLTNTQLTSDLQILASGNLYNPSTATLNTGVTTFSFSIPTVMTITAKVSLGTQGDTLTLQDDVLGGQVAYGWTQTFTDSAFTNFYPVLVSSNYAALPSGNNSGGLVVSQTGTTMTFTWAGTGQVAQPTPFSAVFNLVDPPTPLAPTAPEPSTTVPLTAGLAAAGLFALRRKSVLDGRPGSQ